MKIDFEEFYQNAVQNIPVDETVIDSVGRVRDLSEPYDESSLGERLAGARVEPFHEHISDEPLTDEERRRVDGGLRSPLGFDVIAFYKSRRNRDRHPLPGKWGIFYISTGLRRVTELLVNWHSQPLDHAVAKKMVTGLIREHERFHYKFDLYALAIESLSCKNLYAPLKRAFKGYSHHQVEEALANRSAWYFSKSRIRRAALQEFAEEFMSVQPGAYARFGDDRKEMYAELSSNLINHDLTMNARRYDPNLWVGTLQYLAPNGFQPPEYIVTPSGINDYLGDYWAMPKMNGIVETPNFLKYFKTHKTDQERWKTAKLKLLEDPNLPGSHFKRLAGKKDVWSTRVGGKNLLAHLRSPQHTGKAGVWEAFEIADHKGAGHG